jgi:hypothetical protein
LLVLLVNACNFRLKGSVLWQTIELEWLICRENNRALRKVAIMRVVERILNKVADEHLHTRWGLSPFCEFLCCDTWVIVLIVLAVLESLPVELGCVVIMGFLILVFPWRGRIRTRDEWKNASGSRPHRPNQRSGREREQRHCFIDLSSLSRLPFAMSDLGSQLYATSKPPRTSPSTHAIKLRGSSLALRQSLANDFHSDQNDSQPASSRFSLAHELAAALMPDSTSASRSLADEFGIEFDEEAEGTEEGAQQEGEIELPVPSTDPSADLVSPRHEEEPQSRTTTSPREPIFADEVQSAPIPRHPPPPVVFEQDPLVVLAQTVKSTDLFLGHLRRLDADAVPVSAGPHEPSLERLATDIIRHIDETTRVREEQVRELYECERQFRKIAGEPRGNDILGDLEDLDPIEGLVDESMTSPDGTEEETSPRQPRPLSAVWEDAGDPHHLDGYEDSRNTFDEEDPFVGRSPAKDQFLPPPPLKTGPTTPLSTIPHLSYMRTITQSVINTLGTISEQAQVNGVAMMEAGRKLRALKHRIEEWREESERAEKSRIRVEKWEAGIWDDSTEPALSVATSSRDGSPTPGTPGAPPTPAGTGRRLNARKIVEEELKAFELALEEAGNKTKAIMAQT